MEITPATEAFRFTVADIGGITVAMDPQTMDGNPFSDRIGVNATRSKRRRILAVAAFLLAGTATHAAQTLSYADLAGRLHDLKRLAEPPAPGETSGSWTSGDRESAYDAATGRYQKWWANRDGEGFIRKEGDGIVAAEMQGPGVIWRVWSAIPLEGHIKIFIDGSETAALDRPFSDYFNHQKEPFNYPELVRVLSNGRNNFVPIPYQKSCKVVLEKGWGAYFQFTYTTFPAGTIVPSFKGSFDESEKAALARANAILAERGEPSEAVDGEETTEKAVTLMPGETLQIADLKGPRAISSIAATPRLRGDRDSEIRILRELTLRITWDEEEAPAVWAPLGDFFGTGPGVNHYRTLPMGMTLDRFYSHWYMPFAKRARLELTNDGLQPRSLRFRVTHRPEPEASSLLRFHAKWHRDDFSQRDAGRYQRGDRWPDWPVLVTDGGPGRFCGFQLDVWNPNPVGSKRKSIPGGWGDYSPEIQSVLDGMVPQRWWWGEGDEKFFVDGEKYPSTFGTGSEDYFGYAFAAFHPDQFDSGFESLPLNHNNYGHISNVRFQIADNVPFQKSFEADIEKYHPNQWPLLYATTAYWYQAAGTTDPYRAIPVADRLDYFIDVARDTDIYEAEHLDVLRADSGEVFFDGWYLHFSADHAIIWNNVAKAGDRLVLKLPVEKSGAFELLLQLGQSLDAGTYVVRLDGEQVGDAINLGPPDVKEINPPPGKMFFEYSRYASRLREVDCGLHTIQKGDHELSFEAVRPGRDGGFLLTVDSVRLRSIN